VGEFRASIQGRARAAGRLAAVILLLPLLLATSACSSTAKYSSRPFPVRLSWVGVPAARVHEVACEELRALGLEIDQRGSSTTDTQITTFPKGVYPETGWHTRHYFLQIEDDSESTSIAVAVAVRFEAYDQSRSTDSQALREDVMAHVIHDLEGLAAAMERRLGPSTIVRRPMHWVEVDQAPSKGVRIP
jgi:hypothetical protein